MCVRTEFTEGRKRGNTSVMGGVRLSKWKVERKGNIERMYGANR